MSLLELRGISKWFGAVQALRDVNLTVEAGQVLALVGDNGAGKSTLIKIISGVHQPDAGEIRWEGRATAIASPHFAKELGIETLYQELAVFEPTDVTANLFAGREMIRKGLAGRLRIMDEVRMRDFARETLQRLRISIASIEQQLRFLSGGQRQSVAIGRAIAFGSKLVIMDEPTAALGAVESAKVLDLIQEMRARGLAVIVISHNLLHVFRIADRLAVLYHGELAGVLSKGAADPQAIVDMMMGQQRGADPGARDIGGPGGSAPAGR
jgi:ABC-type sugar transport system ATPase subunit